MLSTAHVLTFFSFANHVHYTFFPGNFNKKYFTCRSTLMMTAHEYDNNLRSPQFVSRTWKRVGISGAAVHILKITKKKKANVMPTQISNHES
jgi:hypothetical protein